MRPLTPQDVTQIEALASLDLDLSTLWRVSFDILTNEDALYETCREASVHRLESIRRLYARYVGGEGESMRVLEPALRLLLYDTHDTRDTHDARETRNTRDTHDTGDARETRDTRNTGDTHDTRDTGDTHDTPKVQLGGLGARANAASGDGRKSAAHTANSGAANDETWSYVSPSNASEAQVPKASSASSTNDTNVTALILHSMECELGIRWCRYPSTLP